jgi:hypothetical protein
MTRSSYGWPLQNAGVFVPFSFDRGAQNAATFETGEGALFVEDLTGHEWHAEQLAVRMAQRRAGLAALVHDGLGVANMLALGVRCHLRTKRVHHESRVVVCQATP